MAKKRRKPSSRARTPEPVRADVRTAERPGKVETDRDRTGSRTDARPRLGTTRARDQAPSGASPQRSRAEKKELARRQREDIRRRVRRAQLIRQLVWITGVTAVIAVAVVLIARPKETSGPDTLPGELTGEAPWPANAARAADRADAIGLPAEGTTMHAHADVQVFVHGEQEQVPATVGITDADVTSLHTHTDDGVVHMESSVVRDFTLGEFFDVWGVRLSGTCLGGYCEDADNTLRVFKDGAEVTGPFRAVVLDDLSVIVVTYGTQAEVPDPIPTFDFGSLQP